MASDVTVDTPVTGIEQLTPEQKTSWQLTGEMPQPKEAEPAPAKEIEKSSEAPKPKTAAESEPAAPKDNQQDADGQYGPKAQKRIKQLLSKVKELESKLAPATSRAATETPAPEKGTSVPKSGTEAAAPAKDSRLIEPKAEDKNADGSPKYKTYEEFMDARIEYGVEKRLEAREAKVTEAQRDAQVAEINKTIEESWKARVEAARAVHADYNETALHPDLPIKSGSPVDSFILDSELGAEVLYYLATHRAELDAMNARKPHEGWKTIRELVKIENSLSGNTAPKPPVVIESKTSKAPPPIREVGGRGTTPVDDELAAVGNADFRSYAAAANRKELAALRKG